MECASDPYSWQFERVDGLYGVSGEMFEKTSRPLHNPIWKIVLTRVHEQSNEVLLATVGDEKVNLSPLTDFVINFDNRQALKVIEDQVLDLQVILPGILDAIVELEKEFTGFKPSFTYLPEEESEDLHAVVEEFSEYIREVNMLIERSKALNDMARSTARLVNPTPSKNDNAC